VVITGGGFAVFAWNYDATGPKAWLICR
jgi:hypothetical protein